MPWTDGPLLALDMETTSVDIEEARIVTASLVLADPAKRDYTVTSWLSDPGCDIPAEATAVHGVTTERAREEGRPQAECVWELIHAICKRPSGTPIVAFVARFDLSVLDRAAQRHGLGSLTEYEDWRVIDPSVLDRHLDKFRPGSRKLDALCKHYGATLDGAHDAASDALAAARLAWVIGKRGQVVRRAWNPSMEAERIALIEHWESVRGDLGRLHEAQKIWARDQAVSLAQHFEAKGEPKPVAVEWPIVPLKVAA